MNQNPITKKVPTRRDITLGRIQECLRLNNQLTVPVETELTVSSNLGNSFIQSQSMILQDRSEGNILTKRTMKNALN